MGLPPVKGAKPARAVPGLPSARVAPIPPPATAPAPATPPQEVAAVAPAPPAPPAAHPAAPAAPPPAPEPIEAPPPPPATEPEPEPSEMKSAPAAYVVWPLGSVKFEGTYYAPGEPIPVNDDEAAALGASVIRIPT